MLIRIKCAISNCYLLLGERPVLVDTGAPGDLQRILHALKVHRIELNQIALILLTHGHSDHAGGAAELRRRSGENGVLAAQDQFGRLVRPFVDEPFASFEPDLIFRDSFSLTPYGIKGRVLATPGHTLGSASVVLDSGEAIIGDVLRGSILWPNRAAPHFFCADPEMNTRSIVRLAREGLLRCYPGNFGSFPGAQLGRFLTTGTGKMMQLAGEPV